MNKQAILIVEALSTGVQYVWDVLERGYLPLILYPYIPEISLEDGYEKMRDEVVSSLPSDCIIIRPRNSDYASLMDTLSEYEIACVVQGSEIGSELTDRIAADLGLAGNDPKYSKLHTDKDAMQDALRKAGIRAIKGKLCRTVEEARSFIEEENLDQIVIKPVSGAGSQGVHLCHSRQEALAAFEKGINEPDAYGRTCDGLLVQELLVGTEFIVDTCSCDGVHVVTDIWRYNRVPIAGGKDGNAHEYGVLIRDLTPEYEEMCRYALETVEAVGIQYGPTHGEYMLTKDGPCLIEVGSRPMGAGLTKDYLEHALPHHITDISLDAYLDRDKFMEFADLPYAPFGSLMLKFFISEKEGDLADLPIIPIIRKIRSCYKIKMKDAIQSMHAPRTVDLMTAPGVVYMATEQEADLWTDYQRIRNLELHFPNFLFRIRGSEEEGDGVHTDASKEVGKSDKLSALLEQANKALILYEGDKEAHYSGDNVRIAGLDDCVNLGSGYDLVLLDLNRAYPHIEELIDAVFLAASALGQKGRLLFPSRSADNFPYGKQGLLTVLQIAGLKIDTPKFRNLEFTGLVKL